jgi:type IV pilus assembly protein PilE
MRRRGFSLIELLVVLVMLGILAALAMPAYQQHVIRTRRSEAHSALLKLMMQQERFHTQNNTYIAFSSGSNEGGEPEAKHFQWWSGASPRNSAYEIEGKACVGEVVAQCVQLVATPGTVLVEARFRDEDCGVLTLTSTGQRLASGAAKGCWP